MAQLKQSTAYTRAFYMVLSSDHLSAATGKTVTVNLSKAGAAFGAAAGAVSEIGSGWYKVALTTADTNTLGDLAFDCSASGCDNTDFADQVTANILGDTLPANVTQWNGSGVGALPANFSALAINGSGYVTLAAAGLDQVTIDGGYTLKQGVQYIAASTAGKVSGAGTGTEVFKGLDGSTTRLTITVDASGNRTGVVYG